MINDAAIRRQRWLKPPDPHDEVLFAFLAVDVIGHSSLFEGKLNPEDKRNRYALLENFRKYVHKKIGGRSAKLAEWDWAGDGGIFAFRANDNRLSTTAKTFLVAEAIAADMDDFNEENEADIRVRITLHRGDAYYHPKKELRRGPALNEVAKLRVPGAQTSITVTSSFIEAIECRDSRDFRRIEALEPPITVYGYVPTLQKALRREIDRCANSDPIQAAHLSYRLGVLDFGCGNGHDAAKVFREAIRLMDQIPESERHRFYFATLREFYSLWACLTEEMDRSVIAAGDGADNDRRKVLRSEEYSNWFEAHRFGDAWNLLHEMEFCLEQLDILARRPVNDPTGLTSLQICLLLERVGYPRAWHGAAISDRLARLEMQLRSEGGAIDHGCGLCTAIAASSLALDTDRSALVPPVIDWLSRTREHGYTYRKQQYLSRVADRKHAFHYAATVLQAMVDYDASKMSEVIDDIIGYFFRDTSADAGCFPREWVRYLHIPYFDFACYIFSAFARTIIARGPLSSVQSAVLKEVLEIFANRLLREAHEANIDHQPERLYAARENAGSFGLGLFVGFPPNTIDIFRGVRNLITMVARMDKLNDVVERKTTIDSNFDRMWRMLDGWLLQWECALHVVLKGGSIPEELDDLFCIAPREA